MAKPTMVTNNDNHDALAFAVRSLAEVAVRVSATLKKVFPGGSTDDLAAFVTETVRGIGDALANEEKAP